VIQGSTPFTIHPAAKIGYVHLRVSDIEQALQFYHSILGFKLVGKTSSSSESVFLSTGTDSKSPSFLIALSKVETIPKGKNDFLLLQENKRGRKVAGLYHLAILLPERRLLANIFRHLQEHRDHVHFDGFADHAVSESIYLRDPDFNGVEIYRDRPRSEWRWKGHEVKMVTEPLNIQDLLSESTNDEQWKGFPLKTSIGHVHLHVSNFTNAKRFYSETLGLNHTATYPGAYFFAADEYHHHIATNIWLGKDILPRASFSDLSGLDHFAIHLPNKREFERVSKYLDERNLIAEEEKADLRGFSQSFYVHDSDQIRIQFYY
jgi:catechol 2,3-dioxygenase